MVNDILGAVLALASAIATARLLGVDGRGELAVITGINGVAYLFLNMGIANANIFYSADSRIQFSDLFGNSILLGSVLGLIGLVVSLGFVSLVPAVARNVSTGELLAALVFLPVSITGTYVSYLIIGSQYLVQSNFLQLLARLASTLALIVGLILWPSVIVGVVLAQSYYVFRLVLDLMYMRRSGLLLRPTLDIPAFRAMISYGTRSQGNSILQHLTTRGDVLVLNALSTSREVGLYSLAVVLAELIWYPAQAIGWVLFPHASAIGDRKEALKRSLRDARWGLFLSFAVAVPTAIIAIPAVPLVFGERFEPATPMLWVLLSGAVMFSFVFVLTPAVAAIGRPELGMIFVGTGLALMLLLDFTLIPSFGGMGAAIGSAFAYGVASVVAAVVFCRLADVEVADFLKPTSEDKRLIRHVLRLRQSH